MTSIYRLRLLLVTLIVGLAMTGVSIATAAPPTAASGTFMMTSSSFDNVRVAGGNTIIDLSATLTYTGTFTGTSVVHGILIIHADGSTNFHDFETFTGTVNGVPGTVTWILTGDGTIPDYFATAVIVSGTGELATLHGVLRQVGTVDGHPPAGTYSGQIN